MIQNLEGVEIYSCTFFEVDSSQKLRFVKGKFTGKSSEDFKSIKEIFDVIRYCMWIIDNKDTLEISKYSATVFMNQANYKLKFFESECRRIIKAQQVHGEKKLSESVTKPGRTYL